MKKTVEDLLSRMVEEGKAGLREGDWALVAIGLVLVDQLTDLTRELERINEKLFLSGIGGDRE